MEYLVYAGLGRMGCPKVSGVAFNVYLVGFWRKYLHLGVGVASRGLVWRTGRVVWREEAYKEAHCVGWPQEGTLLTGLLVLFGVLCLFLGGSILSFLNKQFRSPY